jgi:hypothetical protein
MFAAVQNRIHYTFIEHSRVSLVGVCTCDLQYMSTGAIGVECLMFPPLDIGFLSTVFYSRAQYTSVMLPFVENEQGKAGP